jgi:surface antigen
VSSAFSPVLSEKASEEKDIPEYGGETLSSAIPQSQVKVGTKIDEYKGVAVYSNGKDYVASYGLNFSDDGYYYGLKWQCTEYVKRFYYSVFKHKMPDGAGNAKYYFNPMLEQGSYNSQRGLIQYKNGGNVKPQADDIIVFTDGKYGHVAIISAVGKDWIEVIQQNSEVPRKKYTLTKSDNEYFVDGDRKPAGWLRL